MLAVLRDRTYGRLFAAQVVALLGTGLATVALALLAYDIAGDDAGAVLGIALAIKMVAYVGIAPIVGAFASRFPRRGFLVGADLVRFLAVLSLPFVAEVWQVYVLIFVLQSASAAFTPTFQATIPDVLEDERDYTNALSLSRLAYDLEALVSPVLAAALLGVVAFDWLFAVTALGFLLSAALVRSVSLPSPHARVESGETGWWAQTTRGARIYLATPRLRGLLALTVAVSASGAMVIVNTVVYVREILGRSEGAVALALAAFGLGSMVVALALPRLLDRQRGAGDTERRLMLAGGVIATLGLAAGTALAAEGASYPLLLVLWALLGAGGSLILTPTGRLLRRSAAAPDRPALFAAQFSLSHASWLVAYPLAGSVGAAAGLPAAFVTLAVLAGAGTAVAVLVWPGGGSEVPGRAPGEASGAGHTRVAPGA